MTEFYKLDNSAPSSHTGARKSPDRDERPLTREIINGSAVPAFIVNRKHKVIFWNKACEKMTGIPSGEIVGTGLQWKPFYKEARPVLADLIVDGVPDSEILAFYQGKCHKTPSHDTAFEIEDYFPDLGPDGRWLYFTASPLRDRNGRIIAAIETLQDITAKNRAEEKLRYSEIRYRNLFERMNDGVIVTETHDDGENFVVTEINRSALEILKGKREDILNKSTIEILPAYKELGFHNITQQVYRTGKSEMIPPVKYTDSRLDLWVECFIYRLPGAEVVVVFRDVTGKIEDRIELDKHRNRLQELVALRTANLAAVFRSVDEGIVTIDGDGRIMDINKAARKICGLSSTGLQGKPIDEISMNCTGSCLKILSRTLEDKKGIKDFRVECGHGVNRGQIVELTTSPLIGENGEYMGAVLVSRDITRLNLLEQKLSERRSFHNIVGGDRRMQEVYRLIESLAGTDSSVLITGETGTGKGLVARAIHENGPRAVKPLIEVNCSALAENLLESELFGHVKGAFTGAVKEKPGKFLLADGGTILLDEIGDIPKRVQLKLLRVLQDKIIEPVGGTDSINIDIRILTATNRDLRKMVASGKFREDLYYRLKVMTVHLPTLRDRIDDIPILIDHYCRIFSKKFGKEINGVSLEAMTVMKKYSWPGNIRELVHAIEHAFILCRGNTITVENLPVDISRPDEPAEPYRTAAGDSSERLIDVLKECDWNKSKAARRLGISRPTLYRRIEELNLSEESSVKV